MKWRVPHQRHMDGDKFGSAQQFVQVGGQGDTFGRGLAELNIRVIDHHIHAQSRCVYFGDPATNAPIADYTQTAAQQLGANHLVVGDGADRRVDTYRLPSRVWPQPSRALRTSAVDSVGASGVWRTSTWCVVAAGISILSTPMPGLATSLKGRAGRGRSAGHQQDRGQG